MYLIINILFIYLLQNSNLNQLFKTSDFRIEFLIPKIPVLPLIYLIISILFIYLLQNFILNQIL